jgi:S1/P1 Nuclease
LAVLTQFLPGSEQTGFNDWKQRKEQAVMNTHPIRLKMSLPRLALAAAVVLGTASAQAFGPDGHHTVGAIADKLLLGTQAATQVKIILGGLSLQDAAVWADCAKGVNPAQNYAYTAADKFPECKIYETVEGEAEMADFVRRNDTNCQRKPTEETCHKQYHYSDSAIQRSAYKLGSTGTRDDDIVGSVKAAIAFLQTGAAPAPYDFKDKREALLVLAHYVGDIHQPLHVAAVYLDAKGKRVDPDTGTFDPATQTRGGNDITTINAVTKKAGANLHRIWDEIPSNLRAPNIGPIWLAKARAVPTTAGDITGWGDAWATQTLTQAKATFSGLKFGKQSAQKWTVTLPSNYAAKMATIKQTQLTQAGARLAQILQTIWP